MLHRALHSPRRRATAAVELAAVAPLILFFLAAVVDLGRYAKFTNCVANAARNGAQYASANATTAADTTNIRVAAMTEMANLPKVTSSNPTVSVSSVNRNPNNSVYVRVTVSYDASGANFLPLYSFGTITRTIEMRRMPTSSSN